MAEEPPDNVVEIGRLPMPARRNGVQGQVCGDCRLFVGIPKNIDVGSCHGGPPVLLGIHPQHGPQFTRPIVRLVDLGCSLWSPIK